MLQLITCAVLLLTGPQGSGLSLGSAQSGFQESSGKSAVRSRLSEGSELLERRNAGHKPDTGPGQGELLWGFGSRPELYGDRPQAVSSGALARSRALQLRPAASINSRSPTDLRTPTGPRAAMELEVSADRETAINLESSARLRPSAYLGDSTDLRTSTGLGAATDLRAAIDLGASKDLKTSTDLGTAMDLRASIDLGISREPAASTNSRSPVDRRPSTGSGASTGLGTATDLRASIDLGPSKDSRASTEPRCSTKLRASTGLVTSEDLAGSVNLSPPRDLKTSPDLGAPTGQNVSVGTSRTGAISNETASPTRASSSGTETSLSRNSSSERAASPDRAFSIEMRKSTSKASRAANVVSEELTASTVSDAPSGRKSATEKKASAVQASPAEKAASPKGASSTAQASSTAEKVRTHELSLGLAVFSYQSFFRSTPTHLAPDLSISRVFHPRALGKRKAASGGSHLPIVLRGGLRWSPGPSRGFPLEIYAAALLRMRLGPWEPMAGPELGYSGFTQLRSDREYRPDDFFRQEQEKLSPLYLTFGMAPARFVFGRWSISALEFQAGATLSPLGVGRRFQLEVLRLGWSF